MPGSAQPEFSLTTSLTPRGRPNMAAFMAVNSNPLSAGYGQLRILQLPQDTAIRGPAAGAERLPVQPDRVLRAHPAAPGRLEGHLRQPDHPAAGRRPGLRRAGLRPSRRGRRRGRLPGAQAHVHLLQRPDRLRATLAGVAGPGLRHRRRRPGAAADVRHPPSTLQQYLQQAQTDYTQAQADLRSGDLGAFGADVAKMEAALDKAQKAAGAPAPAGRHPASPAPGRPLRPLSVAVAAPSS